MLGALAGAGYRIATSGAAERAGIVHRLDVGTSGLMVVAKSEHAYSELKRAFHDREVDKIYHAVVQGHPDPLSGTIDAPIGRHPSSDWKFAVVAGGKNSITHYDTLEAMRAASLLEIHLETGRTHQIRVHMAAQRHPCVGDLLYGADPVLAARLGLTRQWLHAVRLGFRHPATGEYVEFETRYPEDLQHALDVLRARGLVWGEHPRRDLVEQRFLRAPARAQRVQHARRRRPGRRPHVAPPSSRGCPRSASPTTATPSAPTTSGARPTPRASSRSSAPRRT